MLHEPVFVVDYPSGRFSSDWAQVITNEKRNSVYLKVCTCKLFFLLLTNHLHVLNLDRIHVFEEICSLVQQYEVQ